MGWYQRQQQQQRKQKAQEEKLAAEQAKKDQEAAARQQLTNSWKDLYSTGGDLAVAESIISGSANGGTYTAQDLAAAKAVKEGGKTFGQVGQEAYQKSYDTWNRMTGHGKNTTRYGPKAQTIYQIMPFDDWSKNVQKFEWSDGSYDERIKAEKAAAEKAEAQRKAEEKRQADELARQQAAAEAQRRAKAEAEAKRKADEEARRKAEANKPKVKVEETPASIAKERTETYTKENGTTITNNIKQNIGNRGDTTTTVGDDNIINNSEVGNNRSENKGEINIDNSPQAWSNDGFIRQLAKERASNYQKKGNEFRTNINSNIFNNVSQDIGNSKDWTTSFGNNNKLNNVKAGNNYSLNLGNVNLKNN